MRRKSSRALGTNLRALGRDARSLRISPRDLKVNPRELGVSPAQVRSLSADELDTLRADIIERVSA